MRRFLSYLILSISSLAANEIELFCDWVAEAKGQELFPLVEGIASENLSLHSLLRKKLKERGWDIRSWEIDSYRPWLMQFKEVKNWQDLKNWVGFSLPRKDPFLPKTKYWMFWSLGPKLKHFDFSKCDKNKLLLMIWEPPTVQIEPYKQEMQDHFCKIFTWDDDLVDGKKFFKFHYPVLEKALEEKRSFEEKKFCVMICRRLASRHPNELYSEREKVIRFFEEKPKGEFDLYGYFWGKRKYKNWQGALLSSKHEKLSEYKFCICYENTKDLNGYVTEKIFDCFAANVVPVYWGAKNITSYVPENCFIDRREFKSFDEVYSFLQSMSKEEHQKYLDAAKEFLKSDQAKVFSKEHFVENVLSTLLD